MAGIRISGGKPYKYITEDTVSEILIINPPMELICSSRNTSLAQRLGSDAIGFFGVNNQGQAPTLVTLADVIQCLTDLGLAAP